MPRKVIISVSLGYLAAAIHLPEDIRIEQVQQSIDRPGELRMMLEGSGLPERFEATHVSRLRVV